MHRARQSRRHSSPSINIDFHICTMSGYLYSSFVLAAVNLSTITNGFIESKKTDLDDIVRVHASIGIDMRFRTSKTLYAAPACISSAAQFARRPWTS